MSSRANTTTELRNSRINYNKPILRSSPLHSPVSPSSPIPRTSSPLAHSRTDSTSSNTHSSTSSPPATPRGRSDSRYPSSLARVPLHRRGTSRTYERLEDLLREAGYKETRIFTPESERAEAEAAKAKGSVRGGVGAVVGFLAGLVPEAVSRSASLARVSTPEQTPQRQLEYSPPSSPLAHKQSIKRPLGSSTSPSAPTTSSNDSSTESLTKSSRGSDTLIRNDSIPHKQQLPHRPQPNSLFSSRPQSSSSNFPTRQTYAQASQARAYLRHMASAPNIQPSLRNRSSCKGNEKPSRRRTVIANESDVGGEGPPPLPRTWLETVARAVLFGHTGAYIGGPSQSINASTTSLLSGTTNSSHTYLPASRQARSSNFQSNGNPNVLSDQTNRLRSPTSSSKFLAPPVCLQVSRGQAMEGSVSRTRVICRSAPGSRSGSKVRGNIHARARRWEQGDRKDPLVIRGREKAVKPRRSVKGKGQDGLPSLTRTRVENDDWSREKRRRVQEDGKRFLSGWGVGAEIDEGGTSCSSGDDDEEEEEGEVDLAQILVPPKRQQSIRSLRKHLHGGAIPSNSHRESLRGLHPTGQRRREDDHGDELSWETDTGRRDPIDDEDGYGYGVDGLLDTRIRGGSSRITEGLRRGDLPGSWVGWRGASSGVRA